MLILYIVLGVVGGALSGLVGIGGGVIIVPALTFFFGFNQKLAQGTTLALLVPPVGLLAAWSYYKAGYVDVRAAGLIIAGFVLGAWLGSLLAAAAPQAWLTKFFGVFLILLGLKMLWNA